MLGRRRLCAPCICLQNPGCPQLSCPCLSTTVAPCARPPPCLQAYVSGVNKALEQYAEAEHKGDIAAMIALQPAIKFNGGGALALPPPQLVWGHAAGPVQHTHEDNMICHLFWALHLCHRPCPAHPILPAGHLNHSMFWEMLCPPKVQLQLPQLQLPKPLQPTSS